MDLSGLESVVESIVTKNLRLSHDESILFFTDFNSVWEDSLERMESRRKFLHRFYEVFVASLKGRSGTLYDKYESVGRHGSEPGENIWRLAFGKRIYEELSGLDYIWRLKGEVEFSEDEWANIASLIEANRESVADAVVAFPWYSVTHTRFRRLLSEAGCRFISMPMLTTTVVSGPLKADWDHVAEVTEALYQQLVECNSFELTCPAGTELSLKSGGKDLIHKDDGRFWAPGAFGNLPAGEAYLVPRQRSVEGTLVLTSGPEYPSIEPTAAVVEAGEIVRFEKQTLYSEVLEKKFQKDFNIRHIAELGVGTNPLATDVSSMIEGEKIQGTVHVAVGDDSSIGGKNEATEHLDHILVEPTLTGKKPDGSTVSIIDSGKLQVAVALRES